MKRILLLLQVLLFAVVAFGQTELKPLPAYPFDNTTIQLMERTNVQKSISEYTPMSFYYGSTVPNGADRLVDMQNSDGGWAWPLTGAPPSPLNTLGPIAKGLAEAYHYTLDAAYLDDLTEAGTLLLTKIYNFSPSDGYLALALDEIFGGTTYRDHLNTNFYGPLANDTYNKSGGGVLYNTQEYVDLIRASRAAQGIPNLAAWDVGMGLVGAASCGVSSSELTIWKDGVKDEINELDGDEYYDVIGLAGGLYGLAFVGEEFDPTAGEHAGASNLHDLADILVSYQINMGGFAWNSDYVIPNDGNETVQETSYAILAIHRLDAPLYHDHIVGAASYLANVQLGTGGWENYSGNGENNEITGEALWAHVAQSITTTINSPTSSACGYYDFAVTVADFINVGAISLVLNYESSVFQYQGATINSAISASANGTNPGTFILSYFGSGVTLADDAVLFTLHLKLLPSVAGTTTNLVWSNNPGDCEYAGPGGVPVYVDSFFDITYTIPFQPVTNLQTGLGYCTIQAAIDDPLTLDGHDISCSPGTYPEMVDIYKSIHLQGQAGQVTTTFVQAPSTLPAASDPLSNIILVRGAGINAEISGLTIKGPGPTACGSMGRGIFVRDGAYAWIHDNQILDIRDNVFSGCQNGIAIQVGRNLWSTSGSASIENNLITGYQKGAIVVDHSGSSASILYNTITGAGTTTVTAQNGIQISRGATASIGGNTVTGNSFHIDGNTWDWGACGILLYESGAVTLTGANTLSGNDNNYYASDVTGALSLGAETFGPSTAPVTKGYHIIDYTNQNIDAGNCTFEGVAPGTATLAQLFDIEDRIWHSADDQDRSGFVNVKSGNVYITHTESGAMVQYGVDAASTGDVVHVKAGTYSENVIVDKDITMEGANSGTACYLGRVAESIISAGGGAAIAITSDGVTIDGFEITNPGGNYAITATGRNNTLLQNNVIHDIGTTGIIGAVHAIAIVMGTSVTDNVDILHNCIYNINNTDNNGSGTGIGVGWSNATTDITNLVIAYNTISNVNSKPVETGGKGAYGIIINVGAYASGAAIDALVEYNTVFDLHGKWSHGIGMEGNTPGALVKNNNIFNLTSTKTPPDAAGIMVEANTGAPTTSINNNSFTSMALGILNVTTLTTDGTCNWYGPTLAAKTYGQVNYIPWLTSGTNTVTSPNPGFAPAVACAPCDMYLTETHIDVNCFGGADGSIDLTVHNGVSPFTFSWTGPGGYTFNGEDPGGLVAGTYDVVVTADNGCIETLSVTLVVLDITPPTITTCPPTKDFEGCNTDAITPLPYSETEVVVSASDFTNEGGVADDGSCAMTYFAYEDSKTGASCAITVSRVWTLKDGVGNTSSCTQTINIHDLTPPDWGAPIFRRDLPLANVNNAGGADRSNVAWADGTLATEYYGDDFKLGYSADNFWTINKVIVWGVAGDVDDPDFQLEDYFSDISLYSAISTKDPWTPPYDWTSPQITVQMNTISYGTFDPASNTVTTTDGTIISVVEVTYYNGESYQRGNGLYRRLWQVTFDNLNWTVPAEQLITYGVNYGHKDPNDINKRWFNHFSNYEKSLGSTPPWTLWDGLNLDFSPVPVPLTDIYAIDNSMPGQGWDKQNDHNVLIYGIASCDLAFNGCLEDAPAGPTVEEIVALFTDNCGGQLTATKYAVVTGNDCDWNVKYKYEVQDECGNVKTPWPTVNYHGYNQDAPAEDGGPVATSGGERECEMAALPPATLPVVKSACGLILSPSWDSPVIQPTNIITRIDDFSSGIFTSATKAPGQWYVDRYAPLGFTTSFFDGDDRLQHTVDPAGPASGFYSTQGRKYNVGVNEVQIDLYVPAYWETAGKRMAGFWGTAVDANYVVSGYPIVEFTSDGANPRFRAYDNGNWFDLGLPAGFVYDSWVTLKLSLLSSGEFKIEAGDLSYTTSTLAMYNSVRLNNVILQGHNAGTTYDIYWDNFTGVMCEGTVDYVYRYEDCKVDANDEIYNEFDWIYTYTINHVTPPWEWGTPIENSSTAECAADAVAPGVLPLVKDVCGVILVPVGPVVGGTYVDCEGTITYTYTYTDCAGLTSDWVYTYTIEHSTAPVVPPNASKTVSCPGDMVQPSATPMLDQQQLKINTGLQTPYWIDFTSIGQSFTCGTSGWLTQLDLRVGSIVGTQNFNLKIYAGNGVAGTLLYEGSHSISATGWQLINIAQNVAPYLTAGQQYTFWLTPFIYNQLGLYCMYPNAYNGGVSMDGCTSGCTPPYEWQQWPDYDLVFKTYITALPIVTDVCGNVIPTPTPSITNIPEPITCEGTRTYTYTYIDCAGLSSNWIFTYNVNYTGGLTAPPNATATVSCPGDAVDPGPPAPIIDACGRTVTAVKVLPDPTLPACNGTVVWKYIYTACDGTTTANWKKTYTVTYSGGLTAPQNATATVSCPADAVNPGAPADITDACGRTVSAVYIGKEESPDPVTCNGSIVYRYRYTACDGTTTADWLYTYTVTYAGGLTAPQNATATVSCPADAVNPGAPADITDACGRTVSAVYIGKEESPDPVTCNGSIIYRYRYTACDGTTTADWLYTYTVTYSDGLTAPQNETATVSCPADAVNPGTPANITDACGRTVSAVFIGREESPDPVTCNGSIVYRYRYTACDGTTIADWLYTYTVDHVTPPVVPAAGASTIECAADAVEPEAPTGVTDICGNSLVGTLTATVDEPNPLINDGTRTYTYTFTDCSGLSSNWDYVYTIEDLTNPVITCPPDVTVHMNSGCSATGVDLGTPTTSDNCTVVSVEPFVGSARLLQDPLTILFPEGNTVVTWTVTDASGNTAQCNQNVTVVRNTISGTLKYYNTPKTPMNNVTLQLSDGTNSWNYTTDAGTGYYEFPNRCAGDYTITVSNINKPVGYINSTDAAMANSWNASPEPLEHVKFLAGDVNGNDDVTATDALAIQNYFVFSTPFDRVQYSSTAWGFWKAGDPVLGHSDPNRFSPYPYTVQVACDDDETVNIYGMGIGDFNGSFVPGNAKAASASLDLVYNETKRAGAASEVQLPVSIENSSIVGAVSLILNFPSEMMEVTSVTMDENAGKLDWSVIGNELRIGWNTLQPLWFESNASLLIIHGKTTDSFGQGDAIRFTLAAEPANELADGSFNVIPDAVLGIDLLEFSTYGIGEPEGGSDLMLDSRPNPFANYTMITYNLPASGRVSIHVSDILGRKVAVLIDEYQLSGKYSIKLDALPLQAGVYTATLTLNTSNGDLVRTIKLIRQQ